MREAGVLFEDAEDGLWPDVFPSLECVHQTWLPEGVCLRRPISREKLGSSSRTEEMELAFKKPSS